MCHGMRNSDRKTKDISPILIHVKENTLLYGISFLFSKLLLVKFSTAIYVTVFVKKNAFHIS